jgi:hypothetical protein
MHGMLQPKSQTNQKFQMKLQWHWNDCSFVVADDVLPFSPGSSSLGRIFVILTLLALRVDKMSLCRKKLQPSYFRTLSEFAIFQLAFHKIRLSFSNNTRSNRKHNNRSFQNFRFVLFVLPDKRFSLSAVSWPIPVQWVWDSISKRFQMLKSRW